MSPRLSSSPSRSLFLFFSLSLLMPFLQTCHRLSTEAKTLFFDVPSRREPDPGLMRVVDLGCCAHHPPRGVISMPSSLQSFTMLQASLGLKRLMAFAIDSVVCPRSTW